MWVYELDWAGPGQGQVADACECGNEPWGSVKCEKHTCILNVNNTGTKYVRIVKQTVL